MKGTEENVQGMGADDDDSWLKHRNFESLTKQSLTKEGRVDLPPGVLDLRLSTAHFEDGGKVPGNWQEHLSDSQVKTFVSVWADVGDKTAFGTAIHKEVLVAKENLDPADYDAEKQGAAIAASLDAAIDALAGPFNAHSLSSVFDELSARYREYQLSDEEIFTVFCEAIFASLRCELGDKFTRECREIWGDAFALLTSTFLEQSP
eukprot:TRINITY_DN3958_c5_g1_i1.p1 TRINITY_DN3958_c5_g1~~TRINITY_DN3958_c5_g1_i1.p1  ORF type:complete len:205 (+),score=68.64 TRINITY_DN3958_c5_g1_i1:43-657(+)